MKEQRGHDLAICRSQRTTVAIFLNLRINSSLCYKTLLENTHNFLDEDWGLCYSKFGTSVLSISKFSQL